MYRGNLRLEAGRSCRRSSDPRPLRAPPSISPKQTISLTASFLPHSNITWCRLFALESRRKSGKVA